MDRIANSLINGYHTQWPVQAEALLEQLEKDFEEQRAKFSVEKKKRTEAMN